MRCASSPRQTYIFFHTGLELRMFSFSNWNSESSVFHSTSPAECNLKETPTGCNFETARNFDLLVHSFRRVLQLNVLPSTLIRCRAVWIRSSGGSSKMKNFSQTCSYKIVARRAYCVGEVPENHVCPFVRPSVSVRVSGPFLIQFLSSKLKIPVQFLSKGGPKKGPSGTFWFQVRDRSRPKNNSNFVTFSHVIRFW